MAASSLVVGLKGEPSLEDEPVLSTSSRDDEAETVLATILMPADLPFPPSPCSGATLDVSCSSCCDLGGLTMLASVAEVFWPRGPDPFVEDVERVTPPSVCVGVAWSLLLLLPSLALLPPPPPTTVSVF